MDSTSRRAARVERFDDLNFSPRFEYGHMARIAEVSGEADGTSLGTGFARFTDARIPWSIQYDEVLIVIEGTLNIHCEGDVHTLSARDSMWLPAGTELVYESESALVAYAIHPANWASREASS